jgi:hypothetical protein
MLAVFALALSLLGAPLAQAGDTLVEQARKAGISLALAQKCIAAGMVFDPSDNSFSTSNGVGVPIQKHPAASHGIYLDPGFVTWVIRDSDGVLHYFPDEEDRYNQATREFDTLIKGRWIDVNQPGIGKIGK